VVVRDEGKGITMQETAKLFQAYSKLTDKADKAAQSIQLCGSTGLGLYNCKQFLSLLGGDIWISWSEVNVGTEFCFAIPFESSNFVADANVVNVVKENEHSNLLNSNVDDSKNEEKLKFSMFYYLF
jgi:signal transduction histidine kinase